MAQVIQVAQHTIPSVYFSNSQCCEKRKYLLNIEFAQDYRELCNRYSFQQTINADMAEFDPFVVFQDMGELLK